MIVRTKPLALRAFAIVATVSALLVAAAQEATARLDVRTDATLGDHLVDGDGRTLYLFTNDADGTSVCYEACATNWPPLLADGDVALGEGLDAALVGTTERTDGTVQVTYGGWPLYRFAADANPGDANGQGRNDVWFVVAPDGTGVGAPTAAAGDDPFAAFMTEGAAVYGRICAACHGAQGNESLASHVVLLADNARLGNDRLVLRRIIHGSGYMPGFGGALSDREVAAVATYIRNSFGNEFGIIGEEAAAASR